MLLHRLYLHLPPQTRESLKRMIRADGHSPSILDPLTARKDALGKKRLDRSLQGMVRVLGEAGCATALVGRNCVEFGAGYVPSDSIAMWLLGAQSIVAVDYNAIASTRAMRLSIRRADFASIRELLAKVAPNCNWDARVQILENISSAPEESLLNRVPFEYVAPVDASARSDELPEYDFLWSTSVLEHIPPSQLVAVMDALRGRARHDGIQVHRVDLRDHRDFDLAPYEFLRPDSDFDPELHADSRGNGMTWEGWESELGQHPEWGLHIAGVSQGRPNLVPLDRGSNRPVIMRVADAITIATVGLPAQEQAENHESK